jgi:hypothetical protein
MLSAPRLQLPDLIASACVALCCAKDPGREREDGPLAGESGRASREAKRFAQQPKRRAKWTSDYRPETDFVQRLAPRRRKIARMVADLKAPKAPWFKHEKGRRERRPLVYQLVATESSRD